MSETSTPTAQAWPPVIGLALGLALLLSTLLVAFGLPAVNSGANGIPLAIVAPDAVATQLEDALDAAQPGGFEATVAESKDAADQMIGNRDVYGAFIVTTDGLTIDIASAASSTVSTLLTTIGTEAASQLGIPSTVDDVVPTTADDPRGIGLSAGALPIALGGYIAGVAITLLLTSTARRLTTMGIFAAVAGLLMTTILHYWFGSLAGSFWATAAAATLGILATGMTVLGIESLLGRPGIGLAAVLIVFLGNPLSGLTSAPEMLPSPWGSIGQLLPPGATGTLLRNVAFFDGAATLVPILVLLGWLTLGTALLVVSEVRARYKPSIELVPA